MGHTNRPAAWVGLLAAVLAGAASATGPAPGADTIGSKSAAGSSTVGRFPAETPRQRSARLAMVAGIERHGVSESTTLAAMRAVPRHLFVREQDVPYAYGDQPLAIASGQTISQPFIVAYMTALVEPDSGDRVLEIGTGSGYQAAVLAEIGCAVYTIEIDSLLAATARARLARLGYRDVHVRHGDGYLGWPAQAPFDAIVVTAAPPFVPRALVEQLARDGRMVVPVGEIDGIQSLTLVTRDEAGTVRLQPGLPVRFVPMVSGKRQDTPSLLHR